MDLRDVLGAAKNVLDQNRGLLLDELGKCGALNLESYLRENILQVRDPESLSDNERPLGYAYSFCRSGATVTFVRKSSKSGVKTPDLKVEMGRPPSSPFYVEVRKFRFRLEPARDPVSKIVDAVTEKRNQLPPWEVGFIAIDNFDILGLEGDDEGGLSHEHITQALCELDCLAAQNPSGWERPGGVIVRAATAVGAAAAQMKFPHFLWINEHSRPRVPKRLAEWVASSLPHGMIFDPDTQCSEVASTSPAR